MHPVPRTVWAFLLVLILYLVAQSAAGVGAVGALGGLAIVGAAERKHPAEYGFGWRHAGIQAALGLVLGAGIAGATVLVLAGIGDYRAVYRLDSTALAVGAIFYAQVAIGEEVLFRGIVLRVLGELGRWPVAMVVSTVLFLFFHTLRPLSDPGFALLILAAGAALGTAYLLTRALWLPIALHFAFDTVAGPVFGVAPWSENGAAVFHVAVVHNFAYVGAILFVCVTLILVGWRTRMGRFGAVG